ncbi:hypothetical protein ASPBRDRAFT_46016 [Aspergillus brasiliensis CBS 101740]|uniref:Rad4 beta-hairpin domain-containing protein n=1 Tax=Aspergillus brasiliensis (strain CBS 101740 / IMI 381727 / IBT 21946) TaxID=767769 RepID=A0A1L9UDA1_ASPBC|nr:hypothetical protein ASPBRDRAFT_46016 [Aspergillus brasiliensis CBS 101740]
MMASRGPTTRSRRRGAPSNQSRRQRENQDHEIPEVYREMLAEAEARDSSRPDDNQLPKRRKLAHPNSVSNPQLVHQDVAITPEASHSTVQPVQTVYDSPSSSSEESGMEWEEVDIQQAPHTSQADGTSIQVTLGRPEGRKRKVVARRRGITAAEKQLRLSIHKVHLLCLLRHVQIRNLWCNDEELQSFLKRTLPKPIISLLHPAENRSQQTKSTTFIDGLNQASDLFNRRFRVTKPGLRRPSWIDDPDGIKQRVESIISDAEVFLSRKDFIKQAQTMQGSRDFGAQLFCALLRSVGVEARLVCSLQPLPFRDKTKDAAPPAPASKSPHKPTESIVKDSPSSQRSTVKRLAQPRFTPVRRPATPTQSFSRPIRESAHPIFWVEAFNEAVNKWIPVDALVTKSMAKPSKLEPPANDPYNLLSYVVAFEDDASVRDVTRRYAKAFNAKTYKLRVESVGNHVNWWNKVLRFYEKPFLEDRDQVEISELTSKTAAEPMPRNIQDFKDHPVYALERHLRRNEVVFPKRVIGQVSLGKSGSKNQVLEPVYRRSDVHALRSADRWYRLGRDIKTGEQPLKRVTSRKPQVASFDDEEDASVSETPLYAYYQTQVYKPPPVVGGRIPKNVYGNLDVYVPSMVPAGGVHIAHPDALRAAKILAIDYADAVTGFSFKGRHGTAILQGVVIADEYREALEEVLNCLEGEKLQADLERRTAETLQAWKHLLLKLRIAERVKGYAVEGELDADESETIGNVENSGDPEDFGGGFIPESEQGTDSQAAVVDWNGFSQGKTLGYTGRDITLSSATADTVPHSGGFIPEASANQVTSPQPTSNVTRLQRNHLAHPQYDLVVTPKLESTGQTALIQGLTGENSGLLPDRTKEDLGHFTPQAAPQHSEPTIIKSTTTNLDSRHPQIAEPAADSRSPTPGITSQETRSDEETSLLSQDPEDDDAIPEWLMSD